VRRYNKPLGCDDEVDVELVVGVDVDEIEVYKKIEATSVSGGLMTISL
jgi:hypothetical protein